MLNHGLLKGKNGIIFGVIDNNSLAWAIAKQCAEEGANLILTNTEVAIRFGEISNLASSINAQVIAADATNLQDLDNLFSRAQEILGGKIDFILHAVAMSQNMRRGKNYEDANYNYLQQTLDVSALSLHKILQVAHNQDAIAEYGSVVALSYIAAERAFFGYNDMADAKALLQSIARNFGLIYGRDKHVRINTISQSPTKTKAGTNVPFFSRFFDIADLTSPLGNATAQDCANLCVMLFSDYTRKITMQNIYHDGGFSATGIQFREGDI